MKTPEQIIKSAMDFDMSPVTKRYQRDHHLSEDVAQRHEKELKRFLALAVIKPNSSHAMLAPLDDFWHTFVIFTREYQDFCDKVAGHFIHHVPAVEPAPAGKIADDYGNFVRDYQKIFGELLPTHTWPSVDQVKTMSQPDLCHIKWCTPKK